MSRTRLPYELWVLIIEHFIAGAKVSLPFSVLSLAFVSKFFMFQVRRIIEKDGLLGYERCAQSTHAYVRDLQATMYRISRRKRLLSGRFDHVCAVENSYTAVITRHNNPFETVLESFGRVGQSGKPMNMR